MVVLLQRVANAEVRVRDAIIASIGAGLLVYVAVQPDDDEHTAKRLAERIVGYRIFADAAGKMNLSVSDSGGEILLVSQFTLAADTRKGMRPGFSTAAPPEHAREVFDMLTAQVRERHAKVASGRFQADMQVESINDGPTNFILSA